VGVIYKITNTVNSKIYIGKTIGVLGRRWSQHKDCARNKQKGSRGDSYLYNAMRKHGVENFTVEVIDHALLDEELLGKEMEWIARLNSTNRRVGYNSTLGGQSGIPTPEVRERMKGRPCTPEMRAKISSAQIGKFVSQETRDKQSAIRKGRPVSAERAAAMRANPPGLGKKRTPEQIERMRAGMLAAWTPELRAEHSKRQRASRALKPRPGHPLTEENKIILAESARLCWAKIPAEERSEIMRERYERARGILQSPDLIKRRNESICRAWTPEKRKEFGEKQKGRPGHLHTPEAKAKMRIAALKRIERQYLGKAA
jgi:group I intron endonuclease